MLQRLLLAVFLCVTLISIDVWQRPVALPSARAALLNVPAVSTFTHLQPAGQGHIPMPAGAASAHASYLLAMPPGHAWSVLAFWFAGSRESAPDVQIAAAYFDTAAQQWSAAQFVLERNALAAQLGYGVTRLGNPVAWLDGQGRVHLFVVATGMGGWAASRIVHLQQTAATQHLPSLRFEVARVLPLSWFWNYSFLVRTAPLPQEDGGIVLPVYFELGNMVPTVLRLDAQGGFRGLAHASRQNNLLQPALIPLSPTHWLALMRNGNPARKVGAAQTLDGGAHWQDLPDLSLDNPDSAVAGLALSPALHLLAHNAGTDSRRRLHLSASANGLQWQMVQPLEDGAPGTEYSYPAIAWAQNFVWVSYTDQRKRIAWQRFALQPAAP